jgi:hypothetical protein
MQRKAAPAGRRARRCSGCGSLDHDIRECGREEGDAGDRDAPEPAESGEDLGFAVAGDQAPRALGAVSYDEM